ncbi:hypothetical protein RN001_002308 [Aquatica leii]|uniref:Uncharacterized protein n=1 Tax=Aquatica leii TaxID=1421715 RepID=A0AAN7SK27_9COLE|nr:hypothetical protein RN001_002308 [Aquatica leii]
MFKYEADCSFKNVTNYELQYLPIQYCLQKSTQDDIDFYISQFGVSDFDLVPSALPSTEVLSEVPPAVVALAEVPVTSMTGVTVNTTAVSLPSSQTPRLIKSKAAYCKLRLPSEEYRAFRLQKRQKNQEKKKQRGKRVRSVLGSSESVQSTNCSFSPRPQKEATATVSVSPFFPAPQHEDRSETNERCTRLSYVSACEDLINAREALREKIRTLKGDIEESKLHLDAAYAPITEPLKHIATKLEAVVPSVDVKVEPTEIKKEEDIPPDDFYTFPGETSFQIKKRKSSFIPQIRTPSTQKKQFTKRIVLTQFPCSLDVSGMPLDKFSNYTHGKMTMHKFGNDVHSSVMVKHLNTDFIQRNLQQYLQQFKEELQQDLQETIQQKQSQQLTDLYSETVLYLHTVRLMSTGYFLLQNQKLGFKFMMQSAIITFVDATPEPDDPTVPHDYWLYIYINNNQHNVNTIVGQTLKRTIQFLFGYVIQLKSYLK